MFCPFNAMSCSKEHCPFYNNTYGTYGYCHIARAAVDIPKALEDVAIALKELKEKGEQT